MKKISTFQIVNFIFWTALVLLNWFYFKPVIQNKYLDSDIMAFKDVSWKYSIVVFLLILVFLVGYFYKVDKEKLNFRNTGLLILLALFISFLLKTFMDNFVLYINTKIDYKNTTIVYKVIENKENKVFELYDNKNFVSHDDELNKINKYRIDTKSKSLFEYKNNDTIHVSFNRGIIGVNFIK